MPLKDPEKRKQYQKEYREKNKEQLKECREKNKEKKRLYDKEHLQKNKEYYKEYYQSDRGIKATRTSHWRCSGLICDDFDALYEHYLKTAYCDACKVELTYDKKTTYTTKCMDHCHETGLFRNILCNLCNIKRGQDNLLPKTNNPSHFVGFDN